jgi:hypothetical protein
LLLAQFVVVGGVAASTLKVSIIQSIFSGLSVLNFDIQFGELLCALWPHKCVG